MEQLSHCNLREVIELHILLVGKLRDEVQVGRVLLVSQLLLVLTELLRLHLRALNEHGQLVGDRLENSRHYLLDAFSETQQRALHVFVVVLEQFVELVEELYLLLHGCDPSEVQVEQQEDGHNAFTPDHYMLMLKQFFKSLEKLGFFEEHLADLCVADALDVVQS